MTCCFEKTEAILSEHIDQLKTLAEALIEKETMDDKEIRRLLGFPVEEKELSSSSVQTLPEDSAEENGISEMKENGTDSSGSDRIETEEK